MSDNRKYSETNQGDGHCNQQTFTLWIQKSKTEMQPEDARQYVLVHSQSSPREINKHCGLARRLYWTILNELDAHPCLPTSLQTLMAADTQTLYDWCRFIMNRLEVHPMSFVDVVRMYEACFSSNTM